MNTEQGYLNRVDNRDTGLFGVIRGFPSKILVFENNFCNLIKMVYTFQILSGRIV